MKKLSIVAALALAAVSSPAFAHSVVSPKEAPKHVTPAYLQSFASFNETAPWTVGTDNYRYHGGPKSND